MGCRQREMRVPCVPPHWGEEAWGTRGHGALLAPTSTTHKRKAVPPYPVVVCRLVISEVNQPAVAGSFLHCGLAGQQRRQPARRPPVGLAMAVLACRHDTPHGCARYDGWWSAPSPGCAAPGDASCCGVATPWKRGRVESAGTKTSLACPCCASPGSMSAVVAETKASHECAVDSTGFGRWPGTHGVRGGVDVGEESGAAPVPARTKMRQQCQCGVSLASAPTVVATGRASQGCDKRSAGVRRFSVTCTAKGRRGCQPFCSRRGEATLHALPLFSLFRDAILGVLNGSEARAHVPEVSGDALLSFCAGTTTYVNERGSESHPPNSVHVQPPCLRLDYVCRWDVILLQIPGEQSAMCRAARAGVDRNVKDLLQSAWQSFASRLGPAHPAIFANLLFIQLEMITII